MDTLLGLHDIREEHVDALPVFIRTGHGDIRQIQQEHSYVVVPPGDEKPTYRTKSKRISRTRIPTAQRRSGRPYSD